MFAAVTAQKAIFLLFVVSKLNTVVLNTRPSWELVYKLQIKQQLLVQ
jgi:hypothetical protein